MPICEADPWRLQYFAHVTTAANIPTEDSDAWQWYPAQRWIYNKLAVALSQKLDAGPHGTPPPRFPVFSKPIVNLKGMGVGSRALHSQADYDAHYAPGHFWMTLLEGRHVSSDVAVVLLVAILADVLMPYDPLKTYPANAFDPPSLSHLFGTDEIGRDIFSRVIAGSRISFEIALLVLAVASAVGWRATASRALSKSPSKSTVRSRSSGRERKTSSTTCTAPISSTGSRPGWMPTGCRWRGTIASPAHRSSRDGFRRRSRMASMAIRLKAPSISSTHSRISVSSISASSRQAFPPRSGAVSGPRTMCS